VKGKRIAIPGTLTTAYLTLRLYEPDFQFVSFHSTRFSRRS
jgi:1,4-dihydroxy-6-naphthoate synthase